MALKHHIFRSLLAMAFVALMGCSSITELTSDIKDRVIGKEPPNPPTPLQEIKASYTSKVDWSASAGKPERYDLAPALDAGYVYAADAQGDLMKIDATNGRQVWHIKAAEPISGGVGTGGSLVLVGTSKGNVLAYDINGKLLWKAKVSSEILSAPRYFDGNVIVRTGDSHIFGLDAADGTRKWVYERNAPALSLRSSAGILVDSGAVYAGFAGGKLAAIRADNGKLLWEATVAQPKGVTEIERISDITSLPVVDGPALFAVSYQGKVAAIDRRSGKVVWDRDISSYSGLSIDDGRLYVSHSLGSVYALDYATSKSFWRQPGLINRRITVTVPLGSVVAVGDLEGYVHFLSREDGSFVGRIRAGSDAIMALVAGNNSNQVVAQTRGGEVYAISVNGSLPKASTGASDGYKSGIQLKPEQSSEDLEKTIIETPRQLGPQDVGN